MEHKSNTQSIDTFVPHLFSKIEVWKYDNIR